jgi:hypothetical protein
LDNGLAEDILAGYNDRSAALVVTSSGAGMLAVLNADLGNSNLGSPASEASKVLPVLVYELVERMLGQLQRNPAMYCGEPLLMPLPPEAGAGAGLRIVGPAAAEESQVGQIVDDSGGISLRLSAAAPPGVYQVQRDGKTVFALALELPPEESDLRAIEPDLFAGRLAGGHEVQFHQSAHGQDRRDDVWSWLAIGCVACMLGELAVLRVFRT